MINLKEGFYFEDKINLHFYQKDFLKKITSFMSEEFKKDWESVYGRLNNEIDLSKIQKTKFGIKDKKVPLKDISPIKYKEHIVDIMILMIQDAVESHLGYFPSAEDSDRVKFFVKNNHNREINIVMDGSFLGTILVDDCVRFKSATPEQ